MMARMHRDVHQLTHARPSGFIHEWSKRVFSVDEARRSLVFVSRAAGDAAEAYAVVQQCRLALHRGEGPSSRQTREDLAGRRDAALRRLDRAIDECNAVGADLIDIPNGRIRFAARCCGSEFPLIWEIGDPIDDRWPPPFAARCCDRADHYAATR